MTRIHRALTLLLATLAVLTLAPPSSGQPPTTTWTVDGYKILRNGQPFFAKGVGYYPLPLGNASSNAPYGDYFYNFDGEDPVWRLYLDRDLPLMRAAGVNLIRLYSMWAWAAADFTVVPLNGDKTRTLSHKGFMDLAYNNGVNPMYVLVNVFIESGRWSDPPYQAQIEDVYRQLATELKDHPATMGFMVGNELNAEGTRNNPQFWQWLDRLAGIVKGIAPNKLTTIALVDDGLRSIDGANAHAPNVGGVAMPHLDVWGINNYRGLMTTGFTDEFWSSYQSKTRKPVLLTEWGTPASTHVPDAAYPTGVPTELPARAQDQATYVRNHYNDMVNHSTVNGGVSSGGALFMWADQWDKQGCGACSPAKQDGTTAENRAFPGGWHDEEWFGIHSLIKDASRPFDQNFNRATNRPWPADTLVPRAAYDVIKSLFTKPDPELRISVTPSAVAAARAQAQGSASARVVQATTSDEITVGASLLSNQFEGQMADWYVGVVVYPFQGAENGTVYYLRQEQGAWGWTPGTGPFDLPNAPTHVGPIQQVAQVEIHSGPVAAGHYVLFLALVVGEGDGIEVYADTAELNVVGN